MGHAWRTTPKPMLSKPVAKRFQKGPKELLKGHKWGEFFKSVNNDLLIEDELFQFRIGWFFRIPAAGIIHNKKYIILRRRSQKQWSQHALKHIEQRGVAGNSFGYYAEKDDSLSGEWYKRFGTNAEWLTGIPAEGFVLAKSKFDLLRK